MVLLAGRGGHRRVRARLRAGARCARERHAERELLAPPDLVVAAASARGRAPRVVRGARGGQRRARAQGGRVHPAEGGACRPGGGRKARGGGDRDDQPRVDAGAPDHVRRAHHQAQTQRVVRPLPRRGLRRRQGPCQGREARGHERGGSRGGARQVEGGGRACHRSGELRGAAASARLGRVSARCLRRRSARTNTDGGHGVGCEKIILQRAYVRAHARARARTSARWCRPSRSVHCSAERAGLTTPAPGLPILWLYHSTGAGLPSQPLPLRPVPSAWLSAST
mmetsp:Transcript_7389/g.30012  ORF Transcript_7389/g.30012 Transcript_7389/m.30012 type:complete len:282 (+) Transcript_7389:468-1313(+)